MEKLFYSAKDISELLGYSESKAYDIIRKLNIEIEQFNNDNKTNILVFKGRINKDYFDKRIQIKEERG